MARNKFDIDEELESKFDINQFKRLLRYLKPYKGKVIITVILMLIASAATLVGPYIVKDAIDNKIPEKDVQGLIMISGIFLLSIIINGVCMKFRIKNMSEIGQSVILNLRTDIFEHLQRLPFSYYDSRPHGKILVRVVNYVNSLSDLLSNGIVNLITDIFTLIAIIGFMLFLNARLTLICMTGLPVLIIAIMLVKKAQRKAWQKVSRKQSNMNAYIHESITGIKVTQSFARDKVNFGIFKDLNEGYIQAWMKAVKAQFLLWPVIDSVSIAGISLVFVVSVSWISQGFTGITAGIVVAFMGYISRFWEPVSNLGNFYNAIINAIAYLERIFETIDEQPLVDDLPEAVEMPLIEGKVRFNHVNFSYEKGERRILKDVSFSVEKGETIALVGPTGAGKTTIVNLLSRFYDVESGQVIIDETDVRSVTLNSLRKQMGVMLQDSFIFSGTIMDNIRYSKLDATDEEVIKATKAVKAHDFIIEMEEGYNTEVNERGSRLSAGQRQLISFARALLADPKILILDEATSSIDTNTEIALQEGLERLLVSRTSFIIAHRLSTIKNASRIMYIDDGNIIEQGTHDELMKQRGAYWELYTAQYRLLDVM